VTLSDLGSHRSWQNVSNSHTSGTIEDVNYHMFTCKLESTSLVTLTLLSKLLLIVTMHITDTVYSISLSFTSTW